MQDLLLAANVLNCGWFTTSGRPHLVQEDVLLGEKAPFRADPSRSVHQPRFNGKTGRVPNSSLRRQTASEVSVGRYLQGHS